MYDTLPLPGTDKHLDAAIAYVRSLHIRTYLGYAIDVGEYLVRHFFENDYAAIHDKRGDKQASFNALIERRADDLAELELTGRTLRNYMAAAEVWRSLPESTRSQLGLRHLQQLAAVQNPDERKRLAHDAAAMHWTTKQVALAVDEMKRQQRGDKKKPGRKRKPVALKAAVNVSASIRRLVKHQGSAKKLQQEHRVELHQQIKRAIADLQAMLAAM